MEKVEIHILFEDNNLSIKPNLKSLDPILLLGLIELAKHMILRQSFLQEVKENDINGK